MHYNENIFHGASQENRADRLWIPESSDYNTHQVKITKIDLKVVLRLI